MPYEVVMYRRRERTNRLLQYSEMVLWVAIGIFLFGALVLRAEEPDKVVIKTNPPHFLVAQRNSFVRVEVVVEPNKANTGVCLAWQEAYPSGGGMSCIQLDDSSPKVPLRRTIRQPQQGVLALHVYLKQGSKTLLFTKTMDVK